jgi:hypothetical protein
MFLCQSCDLTKKSIGEISREKERLEIDGELEPPAPNHFEDVKTIEGIDSNKNGVRDDIERYINRAFPNRDLRMAAKQFARDYILLMVAKTKDEAIKRSYPHHNSKQCFNAIQKLTLLQIYSLDEYKKLKHYERTKYHQILERIMHKIENTKERESSYSKATKFLGGQAYVIKDMKYSLSFCKFEIMMEIKND